MTPVSRIALAAGFYGTIAFYLYDAIVSLAPVLAR